MSDLRTPQNRIKNWTGTVHYADEAGRVACGYVATAAAYQRFTIEDVNCQRCIQRFGSDEVTGQTDPAQVNEHVARRAAERAERRERRDIFCERCRLREAS